MQNRICFIAREAQALAPMEALMARCGLTVWTAKSARSFLSNSDLAETLCIVIDLPADDGIQCLETLRACGVRTPAILIADRCTHHSSGRLANVNVLDVLKHPIDMRALLGWFECVCAAHMVTQRKRSRSRIAA